MITEVILVVTAAIFAVLDTTWFSNFAVFGVRPDFVVIILTFAAHRNGVQKGQIGGFITGLVEDGLSAAPLGFNALIRMAHSAVLGLTSGAIQGESFIVPALLVFLAAVIRTAVAGFIAVIFRFDSVYQVVLTSETAVEIGMTTLAAVPMFLILNVLAAKLDRQGRTL